MSSKPRTLSSETRQIAALPWRHGSNGVLIMMITSRETRRWVIPKGWPIENLTAPAAAAREAWEEAGVEGRVDPLCLGYYSYEKILGRQSKVTPDPQRSVTCLVAVYPVRVEQLLDVFPEVHQRRRKWFSPTKAARKVDERELQALLRDTAPLLVSHGLIDPPGSDKAERKA